MKPIDFIFNYQNDIIKSHALEYFFSRELKDIYDRDIVLFGAGSLGEDLKIFFNSVGIFPIAFCATSPRVDKFCDLPIISPDELMSLNKPMIVISSKAYVTDIRLFLINNNFFKADIVYPPDFDDIKMSYFTKVNSGGLIRKFGIYDSPDSKYAYLQLHQEKINKVYDLLEDDKSKSLFVARLATQLNWDCINCYSSFLREFSEPIKLFGSFQGYLPPAHNLLALGDGIENFFYFNNDVIKLENDLVYVDIGAYNGDSIRSLLQTLRTKRLSFKEIIAFEPDSKTHEMLRKTIPNLEGISINQIGLADFTGRHKFRSSDVPGLPGSAGLSSQGDIEIDVVRLDDYLDGKSVDFIKMDAPHGGQVAIRGAAKTISRYSPQLAFGAYHDWNEVFEIPFLISQINPSYRLYLRHTAFLICETELFAVK
jgi:FkbM family methyltransferase